MADGVGSWADYPVPVDAGVYARMLMGHAKAAAATTAPGPLAPLAVMRAAHSQTLVQACHLPSLTCRPYPTPPFSGLQAHHASMCASLPRGEGASQHARSAESDARAHAALP